MALGAVFFVAKMFIQLGLKHLLDALLEKLVEKGVKLLLVLELLKEILRKDGLLLIHD